MNHFFIFAAMLKKPLVMKTKLLLSVFLLACATTFAQWTSPGDGSTYSFDQLVQLSDGCVTLEENTSINKIYSINGDLTISPNDHLVLDGSGITTEVLCHGHITIQGGIRSQFVRFSADDGDDFHICLEHCTDSCVFVGTDFYRFSGIRIIESDAAFIFCHIQGFNTAYTSGAVNYMNCSPSFSLCNFTLNQGAAISSGANVTGSPQIMDCWFAGNVLSNENQPQINLGPGAEDTIRIVNNYIYGDSDRAIASSSMVGGIAISDLLQTGSTKVLLQNNTISGNRYGYTQQGYSIDALIIGNVMEENNYGDDPMSGGSGISIYGYSTQCKAKLRNNEIIGNYWGITAIYYYDIDMGTEDDFGNNVIYGNHHDGYGTDQEYALYVNGSNDITAIGNYWGGPDEDYAESVIYHRPDLGDSYGLVTYTPVLAQAPTGVSAVKAPSFTVYPNPAHGLLWVETLSDKGLDPVAYRIANLTGQVLLTGSLSVVPSTIDISSLTPGCYVLTIGPASQILIVR